MIVIPNLKLAPGADEAALKALAAKALKIPADDITGLRIRKKSLDARKKDDIRYVYTVGVTVRGDEQRLVRRCRSAAIAHEKAYPIPHVAPPETRPVIVGFGPAGMFAALLLARAGARPIVLERGPDARTRSAQIAAFRAGGAFDPECNVQFGEGGAGTFSDGKLTTRIGDELCGFVTEVFLEHGAPKEIAWQQKPHVGTDLLRGVITSIRKEIESLGGEVHFNTALTGFERRDGQLVGIQTTDGAFPCEALVFAVGHSARDTFGMLMDSGLVLECKPFSVGFRAEHLQSEIEKSLYHEAAGHPALPRGEYQLSQHVEKRCVYTFCMCPGGFVVDASSEPGRLAINGMSNHDRAGANANSALIVTVTPEDFPQPGTLGGVTFQRQLEEAAYRCGGGKIPVQLYGDFRENRISTGFGAVTPQFEGQFAFGNLREVLPEALSAAMLEGMEHFGHVIHGFDREDAVFAGVESRTSSPLRIPRDHATMESSTIAGIYPCGEGAGYAGGITSAAMDGMKTAEAIIAKYAIPKIKL